MYGGFWEKSDVPGKVRNACIYMRADGSIDAVYRKIHLFDVDLPDGTKLLESQTVDPGSDTIIAEAPFGTLGLSVCYDLRFPAWCRNRDDYDLMLLVANWPSRRVHHWSALLEARAIENHNARHDEDLESAESRSLGVLHDIWSRGEIASDLIGKRLALGIIRNELDLFWPGHTQPKLDGAGDLRSVDARALLGYVERSEEDATDSRQAAQVARRFGAGLLVLGTPPTEARTEAPNERKVVVEDVAADVISSQDLFDTELVIRAEKRGWRIRELPIVVEEQRVAKSNLLSRVPRTLRGVWRIRRALRR